MINKIFALPVVEQLTPVLSRRQLDELELIVVDHPQVKASLALQGAHLLSWKPAGEEEVLWLSNNTAFKDGVAIRGGVPVCWPWFGPAAQQGLPAHGFARNLPWVLKAHNEDENGVALTFELQTTEASRKLWPHDFTLYARFKLGKTCEIELEAHGEFETTSALHTYFNVGDIASVKVSGLGSRYIDKVNNAEEGKLADGVQTFPDRTDRVYLDAEGCSVIHDGALKRGIEVTHHHNSDVVGWNPGPALSVSMGDMPDDGYKTFVCVETACVSVPQKAREEKASRLGQTIRVNK
ncbi:MAG: D-hexose-6-phosphate mutarotase [Yokenella regensburgei]|jgi:glucose-6-phosphate 1-epimerase|uniref:Putative glucose-6-phosphate 1-epimerase n=1 Tax=Yokenella regensburgei TaxID=158877 RepID=A0AB38FSE8_9ENTR|nr:D-hexose-6-phosphate mutarotase [Yokenella regensburgei]EHM47364.1 aldose 1-epimerase [Yokenella regensburgei ATCC 43003]KAF1369404.1 glucose-6-phosphate 1-epimerase [Yokenella regensburgei]KFD19959.1 aldose 1-epimerase family protein [Yokenella regensburgei ATCC 49455]MDQ4431826.1 D-hexose-6-phosphate mutarotase [Yokenella regensburgei]MDR3105614.1 D-hexose-6-phosphate mutarotase [Yokenella regensburgei]